MGVISQKASSIVYFEREGRENLAAVLKLLRRTLRKRPDLRGAKIVVFTAVGEGPVLAYSLLAEFDPKIIAVTFPPNFSVEHGDRTFQPRIESKLRNFFQGVDIKVLTGRLPFDKMEGVPSHNGCVGLIRDVLTLFGGGFSLIVQAVLQACDSGEVAPGEMVIGMAGDSAAVVTAATTERFLAREGGLVINEVLCKPRHLTVSRTKPPITRETGELFLDAPDPSALPQEATVTEADSENGTKLSRSPKDHALGKTGK